MPARVHTYYFGYSPLKQGSWATCLQVNAYGRYFLMLSLLSYPSFWASRSLLEYLYAHNEYLMSNLNGDLQEYAVYGNQTARMFGIKYADCLAYKESEYMGCDVINGYMHFLEETYNNGGKNKFFAHQFFINVIEDKATFEKVVSK
jgi:hypothetical protein